MPADSKHPLRRSGPSVPTRLTAGLLVPSPTMTARLDELLRKLLDRVQEMD